MNFLSELAIIAFFIYISTGIYVLRTDYSHIMNRLFFIQSLSLAVWALTAYIIYRSHDVNEVFLWYRISSFGFGLYYTSILHLYLMFTRKQLAWHVTAALYILAVIIIAATWFSYTLFEGFIFINGQWKFIPAFKHPGFYVYLLYYITYVIITVVMLFRWKKRAESEKEKLQSQIMANSFMATVIICTTTDFILPVFPSYKLPALAPVLLVINTAAILYAYHKYNFLTPVKDIFKGDFIFPDSGMALFINRNKRIVTVNDPFCRYFVCSRTDLLGIHIGEWFAVDETFLANVKKINSGRQNRYTCLMRFNKDREDDILFSAECLRITDKFGDFIGTFIIINEVKKQAACISESSESKIQQVIEYIKQNYTSDLSREGLAAFVGMNPDHLSRNFNRVAGKRLDAYINDLRIMKAKSELAESEKTVLEISMESGFSSLRSFNRIFRESEGISPVEFRENAYNSVTAR